MDALIVDVIILFLAICVGTYAVIWSITEEADRILRALALLPKPEPVYLPQAEAKPEPKASPVYVDVVLMDRHERKVQRHERIPLLARRPRLYINGRTYVCARQDDAGRWVYREYEGA